MCYAEDRKKKTSQKKTTLTSSSYFANEARAQSLIDILRGERYAVTNETLCRAIAALGEATVECAQLLSNPSSSSSSSSDCCWKAGTQNDSGDDQLHLDIACDDAVFAAARRCRAFCLAASEETPVETSLTTAEESDDDDDDDDDELLYSLGFDPLDGSSIIDANFSVGGIFGLWPGRGLLGRTGREQVASAMAVYGPRTTLVLALASEARRRRPTTSDEEEGGDDERSRGEEEGIVLEVTLSTDRTHWILSRPTLHLQPRGKIFAPGNLRATQDNGRYAALVQHWLQHRYTLRYTGGMVPDVYHMLAKGRGVFTNVSSARAKAKLRLLYEVAPLGLIIELAGGSAIHEDVKDEQQQRQQGSSSSSSSSSLSVLDMPLQELDQRCGVCFGSTGEVETYVKFMSSSSSSSSSSTTPSSSCPVEAVDGEEKKD